MRKCTQCKVEKELTEFGKHKGHKDGLYSLCKQCAKAQRDGWRAANPDAVRRANARNNPRRSSSYLAAYNSSHKGIANHLRSQHGYSKEESALLAVLLLNDETRCSICGIPSWLVKLNYKKGGPFFLGSRAAHARLHPDRIDTSQPHTLANTRPACPHCNIRRGAERYTDIEVLRWIRRRWTDIFPPRLLWWLNTEPGLGGRSRRNPGRKDGFERGSAA